jgi:hypothetical protein
MRTQIAFLCFLSSMAFGQLSWRFDGNSDTLTVTIGPKVFAGSAIAGAPYSAESITEHVQTLADGTHINQPQNSEKIWRDSAGRTRAEQRLRTGVPDGDKGVFVVTRLYDPVGGFHDVIDDQNKIAHRFAMEPPRAVQRPATPAPAAAAQKARAEWTTEKLGSETIEGVIAEGTRQTHTIPVGEVGNDAPLVTTNEGWYSRELRVSVRSKYSDPRSGDQTTRLTNISRAEPDGSLFQPPAGYAVVDEKDSIEMILKRQ